MKKTALATLSVYAIFLAIFLLNDVPNVSAQTTHSTVITKPLVTISVSLGEPLLKLWGYGQPDSRIEVSGNGVFDFTYSSSDGYFEFTKVYLPSPIDNLYPELCLIGIDQAGRATPPTCIPPLPVGNFNFDVGPVILPPTLSLETGVTDQSSQAGAHGITIPNSEVKIVMAEGKGTKGISKLNIVKTAFAYFIPDYVVKSDSHGNFSFNAPNTNSSEWRVFAMTNYSQGVYSPKSNTLKLEIVSPINIFLKNLWKFILSLFGLPAMIVLEILIILLIIAAVLLSRRKQTKPDHIYLSNTNPTKLYQDFLKSRRPY
jgi:hypothetical protein